MANVTWMRPRGMNKFHRVDLNRPKRAAVDAFVAVCGRTIERRLGEHWEQSPEPVSNVAGPLCIDCTRWMAQRSGPKAQGR